MEMIPAASPGALRNRLRLAITTRLAPAPAQIRLSHNNGRISHLDSGNMREVPDIKSDTILKRTLCRKIKKTNHPTISVDVTLYSP
jgi:hypothetical protein